MRSMTRLPQNISMFPCFLRENGYYCTNNAKEDYNLEHTGKVWDDSSKKAHWRNRASGQPFFAVFNHEITHESQIRKRPHTFVHDPAKARVPAYYPDAKEVREDLAYYYDNITTMDGQIGRLLADLKQDGLADDTVVFFYGDHGYGMPRCKRYPYDSGLRVPLIVHVPEKFHSLVPADYRAGGASRRLVSFVDLAPTMLSLAGIRPQAHMQGHAFLGRYTAPEQPFLYGFRGRMDERYDLMRSVRDQRYVYIRNYMPHKIYGQHVAYMFETPTTRVWKKMYDEGKLNEAQRHFWETKPAEELYDLQTDPDEVKNLAASSEHRGTLEKLRKAEQDWLLHIRDVGLLPEAEIHSRSAGSTPYEMGHDPKRYPVERVLAAAEDASTGKETNAKLSDSDSGVRYWAAMGMLIRKQITPELRNALKDAAPSVRAAAAEALGRYGSEEDLEAALSTLLDLAPADRNGAYISLAALNAIDALGEKARSILPKLKDVATKDPNAPERANDYVWRIVQALTKP